jgi:hypothetical protein
LYKGGFVLKKLLFLRRCQVYLYSSSFTENAQMAKLVDALVSGTSVSNDVQVRVLFWAQEETKGKREK